MIASHAGKIRRAGSEEGQSVEVRWWVRPVRVDSHTFAFFLLARIPVRRWLGHDAL